MAGIQALSLDDPLYSVMIDDQASVITLADILELVRLRADLANAEEIISEKDAELMTANEKISLYWTKILEGKIISDENRRKFIEEKQVTERLMKELEQEIRLRGMLSVRYHMQEKFLKEMGKEFVEIVGNLASCLRKTKVEAGGAGEAGARSDREEVDLEILRDVPVVLKSLGDKIEAGVISEQEVVLKILRVMRGITKIIGGEAEATSAEETDR